MGKITNSKIDICILEKFSLTVSSPVQALDLRQNNLPR